MEIVNKTTTDDLETFYKPFNFSCPLTPVELEESIQRNGQITPITVAKVSNRMTLISGYRRFELLKKYKVKPTIFFREEMSIEDAFLHYLTENTFQRRFNPIEKIRISDYIVSNNINLPPALLNRAELGDIKITASLIDFESGLTDELRVFIAEKNITINTISRLVRMNDYVARSILKTIKILNLSHSEINKMMLDLYILYMRRENIEEILNNSSSSYNQLKEIIFSKLNPEMQNLTREFNKFKASFKRLNIEPPENFEGDRYKIVAHFADESEIDEIIEELLRLRDLWKENPILK